MSECEDCGRDPCYCGRCYSCETGDRMAGNLFCDECAQHLAAEAWSKWEPGMVKPVGPNSPSKRLAAAEAAARFYARYYDGPSEALLGEADRKAFQWIENDANEVNP